MASLIVTHGGGKQVFASSVHASSLLPGLNHGDPYRNGISAVNHDGAATLIPGEEIESIDFTVDESGPEFVANEGGEIKPRAMRK